MYEVLSCVLRELFFTYRVVGHSQSFVLFHLSFRGFKLLFFRILSFEFACKSTAKDRKIERKVHLTEINS
ncbi:hypothetical protein HMPREF1218_0936 [Hoylesella pleuritidis F0068]|uniref:Uncharacterized protein n=1 Tax=Hoylesella pleuritidis F0068 TaxID=1081904 RepID=U2L9G2_9BACT|nr:hypothetical protein HMPREF1218_0936 [Hoylesella pleuritidis F0068]